MSTTPSLEINDTANSTVDELKALIREAEEALANAGDSAVDEIEELRERLRDAVEDGQNLIGNLGSKIREQASRADEAIRSKPYQSLGIALGVGLLAGVLLARRGGRGE